MKAKRTFYLNLAIDSHINAMNIIDKFVAETGLHQRDCIVMALNYYERSGMIDSFCTNFSKNEKNLSRRESSSSTVDSKLKKEKNTRKDQVNSFGKADNTRSINDTNVMTDNVDTDDYVNEILLNYEDEV